jgi:hypothetical protein
VRRSCANVGGCVEACANVEKLMLGHVKTRAQSLTHRLMRADAKKTQARTQMRRTLFHIQICWVYIETKYSLSKADRMQHDHMYDLVSVFTNGAGFSFQVHSIFGTLIQRNSGYTYVVLCHIGRVA